MGPVYNYAVGSFSWIALLASISDFFYIKTLPYHVACLLDVDSPIQMNPNVLQRRYIYLHPRHPYVIHVV